MKCARATCAYKVRVVRKSLQYAVPSVRMKSETYFGLHVTFSFALREHVDPCATWWIFCEV